MENKDKWLKSIDPKFGYYIAGFADGEGSFNVSLIKRNDYKKGWKVVPSFNVSQKDIVILALIKKTLKCGKIRKRPDGVHYYEVTNIRALEEKVIPFFKRFRFLSASKKRNFAIFNKIVEAMAKGEDKTKNGFMKILSLREKLNEGRGRKRKYQLQDICKEGSSETIRRTSDEEV